MTERTPVNQSRGTGASMGSGEDHGYRGALRRLSGAQKSGSGVPAYTRWVNRRLARYAAAAAYRLGWGPNTVTFVSAGFSAAGLAIVVFAPIGVLAGIAAAVLLAIGYVLDSADGQVARLTGTSSPAGEWLDHVVDAIRSPGIHLAVLLGLWTRDEVTLPQVVALLYCLVTTGQFMSQILAEQLRRKSGARPSGGGDRQSFLLLPTDFGVLCWSFVLWGWPPAFVIVYSALFVINALHTAISMRRRYRQLASTDDGAVA